MSSREPGDERWRSAVVYQVHRAPPRARRVPSPTTGARSSRARRGYAFTRELDGTSLLVVANLSDEAVPRDLRGDELVLTTLPEEAASAVLSPWEARIHRTARA